MSMRRLLLWTAVAAAAGVAAIPASAADNNVQLTPVGRVSFPDRGFVIDLPKQVSLSQLHLQVRENGLPVKNPTVVAVGASGIRFGAILAIDSSLSMKGKPYAAALGAARAFVGKRAPNELIGVLAFNSNVRMVQPLTTRSDQLNRALANAPSLAYGTHIFDALDRALTALERGKVSAGSIVLLSDGADVGSKSTLNAAVARATRDHVRIFTIGFRSTVYEALPMNKLASVTGGSFTLATSTTRLAQIYAELSGRLASEYLLEYRSAVKPGTPVQVTADLAGIGAGAAQYTAPTPSGLAPFHRSLLSRFLLSPASLVLIALLAAALVGGALLKLLRLAPRNAVVDRISGFGAGRSAAEQLADQRVVRGRPPRDPKSLVGRWFTRLENDFEIGEIAISPQVFTLGMIVGTFLAAIVLVSIAAPLILLTPLVIVFSMTWVGRRVKKVRDAFANQLPETLQLLASALRSGHSLIGAMMVVVENAPEPMKREFGQIVSDDQIGVPIDVSARRVAMRMKSRDMGQVALIAELQRTAGGNAADVLDTVVGTVRERADVRRLANTLTVQGRMARWILTFLPVVLAGIMLALMPQVTKPLFTSTGGQIAIVAAALLVCVGSFWIRKIVEIEV